MVYLIALTLALIQVYAQDTTDTCKPFTCADLSSNVCAVIGETAIQVNKDGCSDDSCQLSQIKGLQTTYSVDTKIGCNYKTTDIDEVETTTTDTDSTTTTTDTTTTTTDSDSTTTTNTFDLDDYDGDFSNVDVDTVDQDEYEIFINCNASDADKELQEGTYPKTCVTNSDCGLKDGTVAACECAIDGQTYCVPNKLDATVLTWYWTDCSESKMTLQKSEHRDWLLTAFNDANTSLDCYDEFYDGKKWDLDPDEIGESDFSTLLGAGALYILLN